TYFGRMKRWNRAGPQLIGERQPLPELQSAGVAGRVNRDIVLLDTRPLREQRSGGVPGSLSVPGGSSFVSYASAIIDPERESRGIVLLTSDRSRAHQLRDKLSRVGIDQVEGFITEVSDLPTRPTELVSAAELNLAPPTTFLDVRTHAEHEQGAAPGAKRIPIGQILQRLDEIPRGGRVVVYCRSGGRASAVASALRARGFSNIIELKDSENVWRR